MNLFCQKQNSKKGATCNLHEWEDPNHPCFTESYIKCIWSHDSVDFGWVKGEWSCVFVQLIHLFGFCWCQGSKILYKIKSDRCRKWPGVADIENGQNWPFSRKVKSGQNSKFPKVPDIEKCHSKQATAIFTQRLILDRSVYNLQLIYGRFCLGTVHKDLILNPSKCYNLALSIFRFVLAGCFSQWYWTQSKEYKYLQENPLSLSFGFVLKNFGTLASGSIFMTVLVVSQARAPQTAWLKIRL